MLANIFYWEHYDVILILPLAIVGVALWRARGQGLSRGWVAAAIVLLGIAVWATQIPPNNARLELYAARKRPEVHLRAHVLEIGVALPMPLLMIVAAGLFRWFARRDFRGPSAVRRVNESGRLAPAESARVSATPTKPANARGLEAGTPPA